MLIPGVGAQGGDLNEVLINGIIDDIGLIINSSRGIIYAGHEEDFDKNQEQLRKKFNSKWLIFCNLSFPHEF